MGFAYQFDSSQFKASYGGASGLPTGKGYKGMIVQTGADETQKGDGNFIILTIECLEGPCKGMTQVDRLNVNNPNPVAVRIANENLSAYCHVTGTFRINQNLDELCGKPFQFDVGPQKNNPEQTEIKALYDINGNKAGTGPAQQQQQQPPPNNQGGHQWNNPNPNPNPNPDNSGGGNGNWNNGGQGGGQGGPQGGGSWNSGGASPQVEQAPQSPPAQTGGTWSQGGGAPAGGGSWNNR